MSSTLGSTDVIVRGEYGLGVVSSSVRVSIRVGLWVEKCGDWELRAWVRVASTRARARERERASH